MPHMGPTTLCSYADAFDQVKNHTAALYNTPSARLLESTFQLDVEAAREYCEADERWAPAVAFLDAGGRAGWGLLAAMLSPEWRLRPTAESCLVHPFLTGEAVGGERI